MSPPASNWQGYTVPVCAQQGGKWRQAPKRQNTPISRAAMNSCSVANQGRMSCRSTWHLGIIV
jgi:hypothetical protein